MGQDTIVTGGKLAAIADAIRGKAGSDATMTLDQMAGAVEGIELGMDPALLRAVLDRTVTAIEDEGVTALGRSALRECEQLATLRLPNVELINQDAIYGCTRLSTMDISSATTCYASFYGCNALTEINLPRCTSIIGSRLGGTSVRRINLPSLARVPSSQGGMFSGTSSYLPRLESMNFASATSIEATPAIYCYTFEDLSALTSINLPNVTTAGRMVFRRCDALESLYLPSLTSMSETFLTSCTGITALVLAAPTVCTMGSYTSITGTPINDGTGYVYVPSALVDDYRAAANWSRLAGQIRAIEDWPEVVAAARATAESAAAGWD